MANKIAYLDCSSGISGSMLLGALLDAGVSSDTLTEPIIALPFEGYEISTGTHTEQGIRGTQVQVRVTKQRQPRRSLADITAMLQDSVLSPRVKEVAITIFRHLAEAEATVQGTTVKKVHFHEVSAVDLLIDIVGVAIGLEALGIDQLYASPLPLTSGRVETPHGGLPVPAPTTLELLRRVGAPWKPCRIEEELVTPTGAAVLAAYARFEMPFIAIERVGYGFGQKRLPWLNCLRLCLGEQVGVSTGDGATKDADTDWVTVIESHIDNMSGELLGALMEQLFAAGALDVSYTPIQMKKNRPATMVTVICPPQEGERLALLLLRETSTLGVRLQQLQRLKARREQVQVDTPLGPIIMKVKRLGARVISAAPEYEACRRIAREHNMSLAAVYEVAQHVAQELILQS